MVEMNQDLQKQLENMNPEEVKDFQKKNCIFCHIIEGKVPSKKVFEDDKVIGILDINPAVVGHILLIPKEHYAIMPQVPEETLSHMIVVAKEISNCMLRSIGADGTNILVANGPQAGQKAPHFMMHIIPRKEGDGVQFSLPKFQVDAANLKQIGDKLREKIMSPMPVSNIVEAEFVEKVKDTEKKVEGSKKEKKTSKKSSDNKEKKKESNEDNKSDTKSETATLDDIAGLFK